MQKFCELKDFLYRRVVIKVGSNVLLNSKGYLNKSALQSLVQDIAYLKYRGLQLILVSSGAVGSGKSVFHSHGQIPNRIVANQVLASIGQAKLISTYQKFFQEQALICSQILLTKEDFRDRKHYLNLRNCLAGSIHQEIIPIINENDATTIKSVTFTDNDELAGLVASLINAQAVIILTSVDGLLTGDPSKPSSKLIPEIDPSDSSFFKYISPNKSSLGKGGMTTKCKLAKKNSSLGITTHFLNGKKKNILRTLLEKKTAVGTKFLPQKKVSIKKKWIANTSDFEKGLVIIDSGAEKVLTKSQASSLLPIGVVKLKGNFKKGDILKICNQNQEILGYGIAQYNQQEAEKVLHKKNQKPLIRSEGLFLES